jgi:hypothetical protein
MMHINKGDDGIMREVGVADWIARLVQHGAARQDDGLELRLQKGEILSLQRGKEPVGPVVQWWSSGDPAAPESRRPSTGMIFSGKSDHLIEQG